MQAAKTSSCCVTLGITLWLLALLRWPITGLVWLSVAKGLSKWGNSRIEEPTQPRSHSRMIHLGAA